MSASRHSELLVTVGTHLHWKVLRHLPHWKERQPNLFSKAKVNHELAETDRPLVLVFAGGVVQLKVGHFQFPPSAFNFLSEPERKQFL